MTSDLAEFSVRLLAEQDVIPRARIIAQTVCNSLPGTTVNVYLLESRDSGNVWIPKATAGEGGVKAASVPEGSTILGRLKANSPWELFPADSLARENYAHLDIRRSVAALGYLPLAQSGKLIGAIELVDFGSGLPGEGLAALAGIARVGAAALAGSVAYESQRN